jgi:hypothetical protein
MQPEALGKLHGASVMLRLARTKGFHYLRLKPCMLAFPDGLRMSCMLDMVLRGDFQGYQLVKLDSDVHRPGWKVTPAEHHIPLNPIYKAQCPKAFGPQSAEEISGHFLFMKPVCEVYPTKAGASSAMQRDR